MHILHITDPHLYGNAGGQLRGVATDSSLRHTLADAYAEGTAYSAIVVTGDVVQDDPSGYLRFKSLLGSYATPVLCIPGNHDEPEAMRASLAEPPFAYCGTHQLGTWQIVMLNSYDPGHVGGRLSFAELTRLDTALSVSPLHTLVCLHHHPIAIGSRWLDGIGLANAEDFWRVIDAHPQVRAIAWGHVHQAYDGARNGVKLLGTPSTCAKFLPHSERYALDGSPPAYRRMTLHDTGVIDTHVRWIQPLHARQAAAS
jgi:Icc protein